MGACFTVVVHHEPGHPFAVYRAGREAGSVVISGHGPATTLITLTDFDDAVRLASELTHPSVTRVEVTHDNRIVWASGEEVTVN